jgi:S1-C subfamily serine protease
MDASTMLYLPRHRGLLLSIAAATLLLAVHAARADAVDIIARVKPAIVAVGFFRETNSPRFALRGTGFAVLGGNTLVTNAHVIQALPADEGASLAVTFRGAGDEPQLRMASVVERDPAHDLAVLRIEGPPLATVALHAADDAREGVQVLFIGFPVGGLLSLTPATHRGMISSIAPVVLPSPTAGQLDARSVSRLRDGPFEMFQLDATAYPGNSGGPLLDAASGEVIGVVNMGLLKSLKDSPIGQPSGISYAIPVRFLRPLLAKLR